MHRYIRSLGYASEGFLHAMQTERNLRLFFLGVLCSLLLAAFFHIDTSDWIMVLVTGGTFLSVELLNTALERFTNAFYKHIEEAKDTHKHHKAMKTTKDVAAAASLVTAIAWTAVMIIIFWPYAFEFLARTF